MILLAEPVWGPLSLHCCQLKGKHDKGGISRPDIRPISIGICELWSSAVIDVKINEHAHRDCSKCVYLLAV